MYVAWFYDNHTVFYTINHFWTKNHNYDCTQYVQESLKGNSRLTKLFGGLSYKKSGGTITRLHMWRQDGRHNRFPL